MGYLVYFLTFALAGPTVFVRAVEEVKFTIEAKQLQNDENFALGVDLGNKDIRSSGELTDLLTSRKYLKAIKDSKFWDQIRTKVLSGTGPAELATVFAKYESLDVDQWPDSVMGEVQKICQEGLKCVIMDQLYIMSQYIKTEKDGIQSLRTVVTKVTNVLSEYKKIHEKSVMEYSTLINPENADTISESIMKVVKDNNQMCKSSQVEVQLEDHQVDTWVNKIEAIDDVMETLQSIVSKQKEE